MRGDGAVETAGSRGCGARVNRRGFLHRSAAGAAALALGPGLGVCADGPVEGQIPTRVLGRTGAQVSLLGIGLAHLQYDHVTIGKVEEILQRALDWGVNYLDTAPNYGPSEDKLRQAFRSVSRDRFFLVTKCEEADHAAAWNLLRTSLRRLGVDYLDVVHLHNIGLRKRFPNLDELFGRKGALQALREAKQQGIVRFIGATGHLFPSRFGRVIASGEVDLLMNAVNPVARHAYNFEEKVWQPARREKLGLVAMKVLGGRASGAGPAGPRRFRLPDDRYEISIRYALGLPGVTTLVIGMEHAGMLDRAARTVLGAKPVTAVETADLDAWGREMARADGWSQMYGTPTS